MMMGREITNTNDGRLLSCNGRLLSCDGRLLSKSGRLLTHKKVIRRYLRRSEEGRETSFTLPSLKNKKLNTTDVRGYFAQLRKYSFPPAPLQAAHINAVAPGPMMRERADLA